MLRHERVEYFDGLGGREPTLLITMTFQFQFPVIGDELPVRGRRWQACLPRQASLPAQAGKLACPGRQACLPRQASLPAQAGKLACLGNIEISNFERYQTYLITFDGGERHL